ncbi:MAG: flagellar hook-basal body complex protein FliE [Anaerolineaceae bacterium]|jgi:flagellar hook-basal body complex protein FliE
MAITPVSLDILGKTNEVNATVKPVSSGIEAVGSTFEDLLASLNESQLKSDNLVNKMALGEDVDLHEVMIALQENDINFKVALSIRDKLVDAYQEVMRMQV